MPSHRPPTPRRRPNQRRLLPVAALAFAALAAGVVAGAGHEPAERELAERYASAWERKDYAAMHALLTPAARAQTPLGAFAAAHREAAATATLVRLDAQAPREPGDGTVAVPATAATRVFGRVAADVALPVAPGADDAPAVAWAPHLAFPGLRPGEALTRRTEPAPRGTLEARDGTVLAEGEARAPDADAAVAAAEVVGSLGPAPLEDAAAVEARGLPGDAPVGLSGLERQFEAELAGTPGGELRAGHRVLAATEPVPGADVRTSIDPGLQAAAVQALAGRFGGVAVVSPAAGEVLALAGIAYSALQPPGSVFKIVTLAGALEAGTVEPGDAFPAETAAVLEGVELLNSGGAACGGTLVESFARSCNSVFAPMGADLGAEALVEAAESFGFNAPVGLAGAAEPTIPPAREIGDDLALGATAIGQGKVLSTPLHMALVAAAIANDGRRVAPTLRHGAEPEPGPAATTPAAAAFVARAMRATVRDGTGAAAAVPGAEVAGKTGTAELRSSVGTDPETGEPLATDDVTDTDAWFTGFAPADDPEVAVSVLLVEQGAGGATAAPAAQVVFRAAVARR